MAPYYHVADKEALLDGVVDALVGEIEEELGGSDVVKDDAGWKEVLRNRMLTARRVLLRHKWAPGLIEARTTMTPTLLRYMNNLLGILIEGGFSYDPGRHAMHALGSRDLGFDQEPFTPGDGRDEDEGRDVLEDLAAHVPTSSG